MQRKITNPVVSDRHQKIAIKTSMEHFSFCLVDEIREIQTNIGERHVPQWWQLQLTSSPCTSRSSKNGTCCSRRVHYCFSAHVHFISGHFQEATKHSVLVPFCGLLLSVSVFRLPRSATSQSIWVLSWTVKWPGLAQDKGRGCVRETRRHQIFLTVTIQLFQVWFWEYGARDNKVKDQYQWSTNLGYTLRYNSLVYVMFTLTFLSRRFPSTFLGNILKKEN